MANMEIKQISHPVIVISGDHGCGKSYVHKRISPYIQSSVSLNKYDFITRKLLYILDIHPLMIGYVLLDSDIIDRELYSTDPKMQYVKEQVAQTGWMTVNTMKYFLANVMKLPAGFVKSSKIIHDITGNVNRLLDIKHKKALKGQYYELTKQIFNDAITPTFDWDVKERVFEYLDLRFPEFKRVFDKYQKRVVYYAYSIHEVEYFKERYNAENVFITMKPHLQSQLLIKENKIDSMDETLTRKQKENVKLMRGSADCVIENNLEMDEKIINKIMNVINI